MISRRLESAGVKFVHPPCRFLPRWERCCQRAAGLPEPRGICRSDALARLRGAGTASRWRRRRASASLRQILDALSNEMTRILPEFVMMR
jgi:hypothetical protein